MRKRIYHLVQISLYRLFVCAIQCHNIPILFAFPIISSDLLLGHLNSAVGEDDIATSFSCSNSRMMMTLDVHDENDINHDDDDDDACHRLGDLNLSAKWRSLVEEEQVLAKTTLAAGGGSSDDEGNTEQVEAQYGVHYDAAKDQYFEFVKQINGPKNQKLKEMNEILGESNGRPIAESLGEYTAQLQLVRTLRPPPSDGFVPETMSATPPPYDAKTDSFVTEGPYSLFKRPLVGSIRLEKSCTDAWDIYHNISPIDVRGHYLLIPTLSNPTNNWREQRLTSQDAIDLCQLASTMSSNLVIGFNSVGAGASQNHIHCHIWPKTPLAFLSNNKQQQQQHHQQQKSLYPVQTALPSSSILVLNNGTSCSLLDYPCCCIKLESHNIHELGLTLATVLKLLKNNCNDAIHNVALFCTPPKKLVQVYVFCRSRQQSPNVLPHSKLGIIEMLGLFHVKTMDELQVLTTTTTTQTTSTPTTCEHNNNPMIQSLLDVSLEPKQDIWKMIQNELLSQTFQNNESSES